MKRLSSTRLIAAAAAIAAAVLYFLPAPPGAPDGVMRAAAVVVLTIGLLATVALPEYLTALIFFFFSVVLAIAPPNVVFSGFFSGAVWLVFGGLILGVAIETTGLGRRMAGTLERFFARSYVRLIAGTVFLMFFLAFLMPSSIGRVTIMLPIVLALADRIGFVAGSNGRAGLVLAVGMGTTTPTFAILPASVPNVALAGAAEAIHGLQITYTDYLVLHFPVVGMMSALALTVLIVLLFPARMTPQPRTREAGPFSSGERRLLVVLAISLVLWATDRLHGIAPAWVALGAGIFCALPGAGIIPNGPLLQRMNLGAILVLAGVIGLGAVVTHTGLGKVLAERLIVLLPIGSGGDFPTFLSVVGLGAALEFVTTLPGQPAIMTAFADTIAAATGWPLLTVIMAQVPAWTLMLFPYQAPPLVATRAISDLPIRSFVRLLVPFALFGWIVMLPLQYLWWRFLGYFT